MPLNTLIVKEESRSNLHNILTHGDNDGQAANAYFIVEDTVANHQQEYNELVSPFTSIERIQQILRDIDREAKPMADYAQAAQLIFAENLASYLFHDCKHVKTIHDALIGRIVSETDLHQLHDPKKTVGDVQIILQTIQGQDDTQTLATPDNATIVVNRNIAFLFHQLLSLTGESQQSSLRSVLQKILLANHKKITQKLSQNVKQADFDLERNLNVLANSTDEDEIYKVLTAIGVVKPENVKLIAEENLALQRLDSIDNSELAALLKHGVGIPPKSIKLTLAQVEAINKGLEELQPIPNLIHGNWYYDPHPLNFLNDLGLLLHSIIKTDVAVDNASRRRITNRQRANASILYLFKCERDRSNYPAGTTDGDSNLESKRVKLKSKAMLRILMTKNLDYADAQGNRMSISDVATLDKRFYDLVQEVEAGEKDRNVARQEFNGWISAYSPGESTIEFTEDEFERAANYARYSGLTDPNHYLGLIETLNEQLTAGCTLRTATLLTTDLQLTRHGKKLAKIEANGGWQRLAKLLNPAFGKSVDNRLKLDVLLQQLTQLDLVNRLTLMDLESYREELEERQRQMPSVVAVKQLKLDKKHEKSILAFRAALDARIRLVNERINFHEHIAAQLHGETENEQGLLDKARLAKTPAWLNASGGKHIDVRANDNLRDQLQSNRSNLSVDAPDELKPHQKAPVIDPKKVRLKSFTMGSGGYSIKPDYKHYEVIELAENEDAKAMQLLEMATEIIVNLDSLPTVYSKLRVSGGDPIDAAMLKEALVFCLKAAGVSNPNSVIIMRYTYSDKMRQEDHGKRWFRLSTKYQDQIAKAAEAMAAKEGVQQTATDKFAKGSAFYQPTLFAGQQQRATAAIGFIQSTLGEFNNESKDNDSRLISSKSSSC